MAMTIYITSVAVVVVVVVIAVVSRLPAAGGSRGTVAFRRGRAKETDGWMTGRRASRRTTKHRAVLNEKQPLLQWLEPSVFSPPPPPRNDGVFREYTYRPSSRVTVAARARRSFLRIAWGCQGLRLHVRT